MKNINRSAFYKQPYFSHQGTKLDFNFRTEAHAVESHQSQQTLNVSIMSMLPCAFLLSKSGVGSPNAKIKTKKIVNSHANSVEEKCFQLVKDNYSVYG